MSSDAAMNAAVEIVGVFQELRAGETLRLGQDSIRLIAKVIDKHAQAAQPAEPAWTSDTRPLAAPPITTERRLFAAILAGTEIVADAIRNTQFESTTLAKMGVHDAGRLRAELDKTES